MSRATVVHKPLIICLRYKKLDLKEPSLSPQVWQMCLKSKVTPTLDMYSLLLRAAKECHMDPGNRVPHLNYKVLSLRTTTEQSRDG